MSHDEHVHTDTQINLMEMEEWVRLGVENGWCGPPMCHTHDGAPPEDEEEHGCGLYLRIYKTVEEQEWVEEQHENTREFMKRFNSPQSPTEHL